MEDEESSGVIRTLSFDIFGKGRVEGAQKVLQLSTSTIEVKMMDSP